MPVVLSSSVQARWKDCYAPSARVRLTLRTNGEETTRVVTPQNALVKAGFDAPTVAPTVASAGSGNLTSGTFAAYRYVYASSQYPFVDNAVTGGGQLWPRSIPGPASAVFTITGGNKKLNVTVTKTTRSDVDNIWVYRTTLAPDSATATALAAAGEMFYVGLVANDGIAGTAVYQDNTVADSGELLELDNYVAPTMQFCVFDGTQWFGIGNFPFDYTVTLNSTSTVTLTGFSAWFDGRNGQTATFDGVTTGGYDGKGSYYFLRVSSTTATMCSNASLTNAVVVPYNGSTKIHLKGFATTLYRSKPLNPFSWGKTDVTFNADGSTTSVPSEFAIKFGSGTCSAMGLMGNDAYLVLSFEEPYRLIRLSLNQSDSDAFDLTAVNISTQSSFSSHFSQVLARMGDASPLSAVDTGNFDLIAVNGTNTQVISTSIFQTMRSIYPDQFASRLFHAVYDSETELTAFWVKTRNLGGNLIDTCLLLHGPTNRWSLMPDQQVSASATIFDPMAKASFTMLGLENGQICIGFDTTNYANVISGAEWANGTLTQSGDNLSLPNVLTTATSIANVSGTNWIVTMIAGKIKPGLNATVDFFDVSNTLLGSGTVTASALVYAAAGSYYTFNVTTAVSLTTATQYSLDAATANGLWMYVLPASQTETASWVRLSAGVSTASTHTWTATYVYFEDQMTGFSTPTAMGSTFTGDTGFVGCIPCRHRRYFDLDAPTKSKSLTEVWSTMANTGSHYCRMFEEFDSAPLSPWRFQLLQTNRGTGTPSLCWNTKTLAPQTLQNSLGFEIQELGYRQFKNYNYVLKFRASP